MVLGILPGAGNIILMRLRQGLIEKIGLSPEEIKKYGLKVNEEGNATWDLTIPQEKNIELKPTEIVTVKETLEGLDKEEKITPQHISLYEKFVEGG